MSIILVDQEKMKDAISTATQQGGVIAIESALHAVEDSALAGEPMTTVEEFIEFLTMCLDMMDPDCLLRMGRPMTAQEEEEGD